MLASFSILTLISVAAFGVHPDAEPSQRPLMEAASALAHDHSSVRAKVRHRIDLFDKQLVGSGSYLQLGAGEDMLLRLELKIPLGDRMTSLQQVCDGRFLWTRRDRGDENVRLSRIDLRRLREKDKEPGRAGQGENFSAQALAVGGLPKLLQGLTDNFQFSQPRSDRLSDVPIWVLEGTWKSAKLAELLPDQKNTILDGKSARLDELPKHLPHDVTVTLGQDDLFPYRIIYYRRVENGASKPIVTMELFEVAIGAAIDPLEFVYEPGDLELVIEDERTE